MTNRKALVAAATAAVVLLFAALSAAQLSWYRAHSDGRNDGLLDVTTAPAGRGSVSIPEIGSFANGAGPVIGTDGTVYIGNEQGKVFAFHANGTPAWSRDVPTGPIKASPLVTSDGSIFVITPLVVRDHRGDRPMMRYESSLHRFIPGGGWTGPMPFPERYGGRGWTTAPLNIWRFNDAEVLMVPAWYRASGLSATELRLVAFSTGGGLLGDVVVTTLRDEITGESGFHITGPDGGWTHGTLPLPRRPDPGVAIYTYPGGGTPFVVVSDSRRQLVGYTFELVNDGTSGKFTERFRLTDDKLSSPPVVLDDGHTVVGTEDGRLVFAGPNMTPVPAVRGLGGAVYAAPTRTADGRLVVVPYRAGSIAVLRQNAVVSRIPLPGESIASAAASHTHLFVSMKDAFVTYDAATMTQVSRFPWVGGGLWPPVIGPHGHVYAMASNILFVFPPPAQRDPRRPPGGGILEPR